MHQSNHHVLTYELDVACYCVKLLLDPKKYAQEHPFCNARNGNFWCQNHISMTKLAIDCYQPCAKMPFYM